MLHMKCEQQLIVIPVRILDNDSLHFYFAWSLNMISTISLLLYNKSIVLHSIFLEIYIWLVLLLLLPLPLYNNTINTIYNSIILHSIFLEIYTWLVLLLLIQKSISFALHFSWNSHINTTANAIKVLYNKNIVLHSIFDFFLKFTYD